MSMESADLHAWHVYVHMCRLMFMFAGCVAYRVCRFLWLCGFCLYVGRSVLICDWRVGISYVDSNVLQVDLYIVSVLISGRLIVIWGLLMFIVDVLLRICVGVV